MGRRHKKSGSKTPSPCVSANASPALPPMIPTVEPPTLDQLSPVVEEQKPLHPSPEVSDLSGSPVEIKVEDSGLIRRILNWIPYFRS